MSLASSQPLTGFVGVCNYSQACRAVDAAARRAGYRGFDGNPPSQPPLLTLDDRLEAAELFLDARLAGLDAGGWREAISRRCEAIIATATVRPTRGRSA